MPYSGQKVFELAKEFHCSKDELINFLIRLLNYKPEDRYSFEQIYRNKWLNKNFEYINDVLASFENDEEKLLMEFQKQDFIIKKKENIKFINKNILKKEEENESKKSCGKKFTFKKKDLDIFSDFNIKTLINNEFNDQSNLNTTLNYSKN